MHSYDEFCVSTFRVSSYNKQLLRGYMNRGPWRKERKGCGLWRSWAVFSKSNRSLGSVGRRGPFSLRRLLYCVVPELTVQLSSLELHNKKNNFGFFAIAFVKVVGKQEIGLAS